MGILSIFLMGAAFLAAIGGQASAGAVVEVYFLAEPQVVRNYVTNFGYDESAAKVNVLGDMELMAYQVKEYFNSLDANNINIEIRVKKMEILTTDLYQDCHIIKNTKLFSDFGLASTQAWVNANKPKSQLNYDMVVVWTGYELYSGDRRLSTGISSHGNICSNEDAVAIVEFDGTQKTAVLTAREIAHCLGATPDGGNGCGYYDGFIMTPFYSPTSVNRWSFSSCSIAEFKAKLEQSSSSCLEQTTSPQLVIDLVAQSKRDIMDVSNICKRGTLYADSYFCQNVVGMTEGDGMCQNIVCAVENGGNTCHFYTPTEGMLCSAGKRCNRGKCEASSIPAPEGVDPNCLYGDSQGTLTITKNSVTVTKSCTDLIADVNFGISTCYMQTVEQHCCETCANNVKSDDPDCKYGDKVQSCHQGYCELYSSYCCETCNNPTKK